MDSSKTSFASDVTCCGLPTIESYEVAPSWFGTRQRVPDAMKRATVDRAAARFNTRQLDSTSTSPQCGIDRNHRTAVVDVAQDQQRAIEADLEGIAVIAADPPTFTVDGMPSPLDIPPSIDLEDL